MPGPYQDGIITLQSENLYGNFYFGNGTNAEVDINGATMIAPVLERKSATQLASYPGKAIGQLVYNTTSQTINYWDGTAWRQITAAAWGKPYPARIAIVDNTTTPTTLETTYTQNSTNFTFNTGDRVLFANNGTTGTTYNGLYYYNGTQWVRHDALNDNDEIPGSLVVIMEGAYDNQVFICATDPTGFNVGTSNIVYIPLETPNSYNFAEGLMQYSGNKVKVDYVSGSGLTFVGTGDSAQLDVAVKSDGAITKAGGLAVNVDGTTVQIVGNQLRAIGGGKFTGVGVTGDGTTKTVTINASSLNYIESVVLRHISGDYRLQPYDIFNGYVNINPVTKDVTVKFSTVNNATYDVSVYGY